MEHIEKPEDQLEQYLQKIEEGKSDPLIAQIVALQAEYIDQRVNLTDEQGEEIKQLAIQFIKKLSDLDLEKLVQQPHLIASIFQREIYEGLNLSRHENYYPKLCKKFNKRLNPYMPNEAASKIVFLAYATKELGELQEKFLQEYLHNKCDCNGSNHIRPKSEEVKYVVHKEEADYEGTFKYANPALIKFHDLYQQAWERANKLKETSFEFKKVIHDPQNQNSPALDKAIVIGCFNADWGNGIMSYFSSKFDGTMSIPCTQTGAPYGYEHSFDPSDPLRYVLYHVREIDEENGIVHLVREEIKKLKES
jgi:hypothetical protein